MSKYILKFNCDRNHELEGEEFSFARDLCEGDCLCVLDIEYTVGRIEFEIVDDYSVERGTEYKSKTYLWLS
jgi:hypothetical protein